MSPLKNKLSLKTFGLVYPFEYDFKCHYNTIAPGHLILRPCSKNREFRVSFKVKLFYNKQSRI